MRSAPDGGPPRDGAFREGSPGNCPPDGDGHFPSSRPSGPPGPPG